MRILYAYTVTLTMLLGVACGGEGSGVTPACDDGVLNGTETDVDCGGGSCGPCDDGASCVAESDCASGVCEGGVCQPPTCGDGVVNGTEECDDGGPSATCAGDCTTTSCGDGVVDATAGEECDDGGESATCDSDCTTPSCGDGVFNATAGEECDDGGESATCDSDCTTPSCGDGVVNAAAGEGCDDAGETATCDSDCTDAVCGDGVVNTTAGETCDASGESSTCDVDCTDPSCGDGVANAAAGEDCDDAGESASCDADCSLAECGDSFVNVTAGEICDDGNAVDDFTCSAGCTLSCGPLYGECNGDISTYCLPNGSGTATQYCDPLQGMACNPSTGLCDGPCSLVVLGRSYLGCDFYPTITNNGVDASFSFAVTVSNSGSTTANVSVTQAGATVTTTTVAPGDVAAIALPWVSSLKDASTALVVDGAYRLRSDQPVAVYQYSPKDYTNGANFTYSNDAALLMPVHTWGADFVVVSRNHWGLDLGGAQERSGHYAVTAMADNTTVTLTPSATGGNVQAGAGVNANGTGTVTLQAGDVLHVSSAAGAISATSACDSYTCYLYNSDLTGTSVTADKPVQVIGGHACTFIPYYVWACDHLEESIPPLLAAGYTYIVSPPLIGIGQTKAQMVRIVAGEDNVTLTYDPAQAGAPTSLAVKGDYLEIDQTSASFMISADKKILVAQYMLGQEAGGSTGDPAMTLAIPLGQYRTDYLFHAPTNYETNYVAITALSGTTVTLDTVAVTGFTPIGTSGYSVATVQLSNAGDGNHEILSNTSFGISVYGYGQYTSYWYPGGTAASDL